MPEIQLRVNQNIASTPADPSEGQIISDVAAPVNGNDTANKDYIDSVSQGLSM